MEKRVSARFLYVFVWCDVAEVPPFRGTMKRKKALVPSKLILQGQERDSLLRCHPAWRVSALSCTRLKMCPTLVTGVCPGAPTMPNGGSACPHRSIPAAMPCRLSTLGQLSEPFLHRYSSESLVWLIIRRFPCFVNGFFMTKGPSHISSREYALRTG